MSKFDIVVVGAGISGISAAIGLSRKKHNVVVVDAYPELSTIGDGIALAANCQRVFDYYGIEDKLRSKMRSHAKQMNHRRYDTGEVISTRDMKAQEDTYQYP